MSPYYYARIRPSSKYFGQDTGKPFPVTLNAGDNRGYIWQGGPGGQYRHSDLMLFSGGPDDLQPIPLFANGEERAYVQLALEEYKRLAEQGRLYPNAFGEWAQRVIDNLQTITAIAESTYKEEED